MIFCRYRKTFHTVISLASVPTALTGIFSQPGDKCKSPLLWKKSPAVPLQEFVTAATGCLTGCAERPQNGAPFSCDTLLFPVSPHFTRVISCTQKKESKHLSRHCCRVERCRAGISPPPPCGRRTRVRHTRKRVCIHRISKGMNKVSTYLPKFSKTNVDMKSVCIEKTDQLPCSRKQTKKITTASNLIKQS